LHKKLLARFLARHICIEICLTKMLNGKQYPKYP
jgi:hypothetical protein